MNQTPQLTAEVIPEEILFGSILGGSAGDIIPPAKVIEKLQRLLGEDVLKIFTGVSNGAINPDLISKLLNVTLLEDPIGDLISSNINGSTSSSLMQFGNIYIGMYKRVGEAVDSYYKYLTDQGFFSNSGPKVLLINPSTYPTIAPIIKFLESNGVVVLQIDEVGNNP
ncbi:MAG: hypothetical protein ACMG57_04555, partial [Candidatus Dojkabacteria bacterium]